MPPCPPRPRRPQELVTFTFKQIDTDASGALDGPELRRALNLLGMTSVSDQDLISRHDGSRDARIQVGAQQLTRSS